MFFADLMWSDPEEIDGLQLSPRGAGYLFGETPVKNVLIETQLASSTMHLSLDFAWNDDRIDFCISLLSALFCSQISFFPFFSCYSDLLDCRFTFMVPLILERDSLNVSSSSSCW